MPDLRPRSLRVVERFESRRQKKDRERRAAAREKLIERIEDIAAATLGVALVVGITLAIVAELHNPWSK